MIGRFERDGHIVHGEISGRSVTSALGTYNVSELRVLPPVIPSKIICIGLNYVDHAEELRLDIPDRPLIFLKPPSSVIGPNENIVYPTSSAHVDYEGELAVVISQRCKDVHDPEQVILGYTCFNDVTARDLQALDGQWTRSKSFDTFAPLGPYIATNIDSTDLSIITQVDGHTKQNSNTSNLIFDVKYLVRYVSRIMTLEAGDVIATGTPAGVGPLEPSSTVKITIRGIGTLKNNVTSQQNENESPTI